MSLLPVVSLVDVSVHFRIGEREIHALHQVSLDVLPRSSVALVGRSGSGKSTLISVLSLLRRPTHGQVLVRGNSADALADSELSRLRGSMIGTVFQSFHLDPSSTAAANVMLPWYFSDASSMRKARSRARQLLDIVGIADLADRRPGQMSGGQRQRVAIARALYAEPPLLIADEPTGNLDEDTAAEIADVIFSLPTMLGSAVVVVTHDAMIAAKAQRRIALARGQMVDGSDASLAVGHPPIGSSR